MDERLARLSRERGLLSLEMWRTRETRATLSSDQVLCGVYCSVRNGQSPFIHSHYLERFLLVRFLWVDGVFEGIIIVIHLLFIFHHVLCRLYTYSGFSFQCSLIVLVLSSWSRSRGNSDPHISIVHLHQSFNQYYHRILLYMWGVGMGLVFHHQVLENFNLVCPEPK